jgi:hypothetical protein
MNVDVGRIRGCDIRNIDWMRDSNNVVFGKKILEGASREQDSSHGAHFANENEISGYLEASRAETIS